MGKYFELTLQAPQYQATAVREKNRDQAAGAMQLQAWHGVAMAALMVMGILYYLVLANSGATASYQITRMQSSMSNMTQQQKKLEMQRAESQSMQNIQSNPTIATMVPVSSVTYLAQ